MSLVEIFVFDTSVVIQKIDYICGNKSKRVTSLQAHLSNTPLSGIGYLKLLELVA